MATYADLQAALATAQTNVVAAQLALSYINDPLNALIAKADAPPPTIDTSAEVTICQEIASRAASMATVCNQYLASISAANQWMGWNSSAWTIIG